MLDEQLLRAVDRNHLMAYDECTVTPCQHSSMGESDGRINIPGTMSCPTLHIAAPCPALFFFFLPAFVNPPNRSPRMPFRHSRRAGSVSHPATRFSCFPCKITSSPSPRAPTPRLDPSAVARREAPRTFEMTVRRWPLTLRVVIGRDPFFVAVTVKGVEEEDMWGD